MFYALKPLLKSKSSPRKKFSGIFSLASIFRIILLHLNNVRVFFDCVLTKSTTTYLQLLKLGSAFLHQIFIFHQMIALEKL